MSRALSTLAQGSKIKYGQIYGRPIVWLVGEQNHAGYPANSTTLVSERIIKIMCADAKEASNSYNDRKNYGNNRWTLSNIRRWLNSDAAAGGWYGSGAHSADAPPNTNNVGSGNPYDAQAGFLNAFSANERNTILNTTITVGKSSLDGGGTESDTCKVFNLSCTEVGLAGDHTCGTIIALFNTAANRQAKPTADAVSNSTYTNSSLNANSNWYWWLRDATASNSYYVRDVHTDGTLNSDHAYGGGYGLRPALNLPSGLLISNTVDADGCYTVVWNQPPSTPGNCTAPGTINGGKTARITWGASTDPDGNLSGYRLERQYYNSADVGEGWAQIYQGPDLYYDDVPTFGKYAVAYRVKAYDAAGAESSYCTSAKRTIVNNHAPVISGSDGSLGTNFDATPPSFTYKVTDEDNDTVTVVITLDGVTIKTFTATLNTNYTQTFTAGEWQQILNGGHTIVVTATDNKGASATRTKTFGRATSKVEFKSEIMDADDRPTKALFSISGAFSAGCQLTVLASNNANDATPHWQDVTDKVQRGEKIFFTQETKTATKWGVQIHATLRRDTAVDPCYITSIGGNFE